MARGRRRDSLDEAHVEFVGMLHEARRALASALAARLGEVDVAVACAEVAELEQRADAAEIRLRRRLLVHATVHGAGDIPACLTYMSIGKDAERITDLALGLCRIAERAGRPSTPVREDLANLGRTVLSVLDDVPGVIEAENADAAGLDQAGPRGPRRRVPRASTTSSGASPVTPCRTRRKPGTRPAGGRGRRSSPSRSR